MSYLDEVIKKRELYAGYVPQEKKDVRGIKIEEKSYLDKVKAGEIQVIPPGEERPKPPKERIELEEPEARLDYSALQAQYPYLRDVPEPHKPLNMGTRAAYDAYMLTSLPAVAGIGGFRLIKDLALHANNPNELESAIMKSIRDKKLVSDAKNISKEALGSLWKTVRHPIKSIEEHPVMTAYDILFLSSLAKGPLTMAGIIKPTTIPKKVKIPSTAALMQERQATFIDYRTKIFQNWANEVRGQKVWIPGKAGKKGKFKFIKYSDIEKDVIKNELVNYIEGLKGLPPQEMTRNLEQFLRKRRFVNAKNEEVFGLKKGKTVEMEGITTKSTLRKVPELAEEQTLKGLQEQLAKETQEYTKKLQAIKEGKLRYARGGGEWNTAWNKIVRKAEETAIDENKVFFKESYNKIFGPDTVKKGAAMDAEAYQNIKAAETFLKKSMMPEEFNTFINQFHPENLKYVGVTPEIPVLNETIPQLEKQIAELQDVVRQKKPAMQYEVIGQKEVKGTITDIQTTAEARKYLPFAVSKGLINEQGNLTVRLQTVKDMYKSYRAEQAKKGIMLPEEPMYYPHQFPKKVVTAEGQLKEKGQIKGMSWGEFFAQAKKYTPGFLKKAKGKEGYIKDPFKTLPLHDIRVASAKASEELLDDIIRYKAYQEGGKAKQFYSGEPLPESHPIPFYPEGVMKYYRGVIDIEKEMIKRYKNNPKILDDELLDILFDGIQNMEKTFLGAKKAKCYAISIDDFKAMKDAVAPEPAWLKTLYDPAVNVWRHMILFIVPRWAVNNIMGNEVFMAMAGVMPIDRIQALQRKYVRRIPDQIKQDTFLQSNLFLPKLGGAIEATGKDIPIINKIPGAGKIPIGQISDIVRKVGVVITQHPYSPLGIWEKIVTGISGGHERYSRTATYIRKAKEKIKVGDNILTRLDKMFKEEPRTIEETFVKPGGKGLFTKKRGETKIQAMMRSLKETDPLMAKLKTAQKNPALMKELIDDVNYFLADYRKMSINERRIVRRLFPFWTFTKHTWKLNMSYPFTNPKKAWVMKELAMIQDEYKEDLMKWLNVWAGVGGRPEYLDMPGVTEVGGGALSLRWMNPGQMPSETFRALALGAGLGGVLTETGLGLPTSPAIQAIYSQVTGIDPFTRRPYTKKGQVPGYKLVYNDKGFPVGVVKGPEKVTLGILENLARYFIPPYRTITKMTGPGYPEYTGEPYIKHVVKGGKTSLARQRKNKFEEFLRWAGVPKYSYEEAMTTVREAMEIKNAYERLYGQEALDWAMKEKVKQEKGGK